MAQKRKKPARNSKGKKPKVQRSVGWRLGQLLLVALFGFLIGGAGVVYKLYSDAKIEVQELLAKPVWRQNGRVLSAPMEIWAGMHLTPGELAEDLQAAGYARVAEVARPGDFAVTEDAILVNRPAAEGPDWKIPDAEVLITFKGGRISSTSPSDVIHFAPLELAALRGEENESRRPVSLADLPDHVVRAILAMEDARFFDHEGVDPIGITRAVITNLTDGRVSQGGSTLTQQLVKNLFLTQEKTYERKAREALLAVALEDLYSKEQILELYLNEIYLGQVGGVAVAGVNEAARAYFGKRAERLDVGEAATIAGIISAPNRYSPLRHPEAALERRNLALARMVEVGWLSAGEAAALQAQPLKLAPTSLGRRSPWLVDAAVEQIETALNEPGAVTARGLELHTTLQPGLQRIAEKVVAESLDQLEKSYPKTKGAEMALVAVRVSDGAVLAMVGGRDYDESQFNRALMAKRQVGSTVKPFTYLFAIDGDTSRSPGTPVEDQPIERTAGGQAWAPQNYDGEFKGTVSYRTALAESRNVPAVLVAEAVGLSRLQQGLLELGLTGATALPSAALGSFEATPLEIAGAYTVFPSGGEAAAPYLLRVVRDREGGAVDGVPAGVTEQPKKRIASPQSAWMATDMLQEVIRSGTARAASRFGLVGPAAGKTGTTDENHDAWFAGFTRDLVIVVWVGFDHGKDLGLTGGRAALPAWSRFVAQAGLRLGPFPRPDGLASAELCRATLQPVSEDCPCEAAEGGGPGDTYTEWFYAGEVPLVECEPDRPILDAISRVLGRGEDAEVEPDPDEGKDRERKGLFKR